MLHVQGGFLTSPPDFQYQNEKTCSANEELFYIDIPLSASKFASYFGNYNSYFSKFSKNSKFKISEKIPKFRIFFSKISKGDKISRKNCIG